MAAFSSAGKVRRRPAPVNTSRRRARSGLCISSEIDICRSSQPAPNIILYARRRKVHPDDANDHLSVSALEQQYRSCTDVTAARHFQTIWLLAKGHDLA